jgi:hypothetical protein
MADLNQDPSLHSQSSQDANNPPRDRSHQVRSAFDSWHKSLGDRVSKEDEERMLGIREAVESGDRVAAEKHLARAREESGWLYEELMKHPEVSAIMRELSIMGF